MTLSPTGRNVPHICVTSIPESQISVRLALRPVVLSYMPFWDKCTEWSQMTLNTTRSNVQHICTISVPSSQILVCFALWSGVFEFEDILKQVPANDPKMILNITRSNIFSSAKFHSVCFTTRCFRDTRLQKIANVPNDARITLDI